MDDLTAFVKARLDEDERFALAASARELGEGDPVPGGEHWRWECCKDDTPVDPELDIANGEMYALSHDEAVYHGCGGYEMGLRSVEQYPTMSVGPLPHLVLSADEVSPQSARHIARHDPARVLREVEAKRAILAAHPRVESLFTECGTCHESEEGWAATVPVQWPCSTVRHVAAVWSDHPDYRAEWKP